MDDELDDWDIASDQEWEPKPKWNRNVELD